MAVPDVEAAPLKKRIILFLKFSIFLSLGLLVIWLSLHNLSPSEKNAILESFRDANYNWVILAFFLGICSHILRALRWRIFFEPMGFHPSFKNTFYAVMVGYFANMAFPRLGEVTRCGILTKYEGIPFNKSFGTVITERALDMILFILLFFLMIFTQIGTIGHYLRTNVYPKIQGKFFDPFSNPLLIITLAALVIAAVVSVFIFRKRIKNSRLFHKVWNLIAGFGEGLKSLARINHPLLFVFYTLAIWFLYFMMLYLCFFCFAETSHLSPGAGLSALVLGTVGIMVTPGGIGLYPAIIQETLILYGISKTTGLALGWISWSAQTIMILMVGSLSLILLSFNKKRNEQIGAH